MYNFNVCTVWALVAIESSDFTGNTGALLVTRRYSLFELFPLEPPHDWICCNWTLDIEHLLNPLIKHLSLQKFHSASYLHFYDLSSLHHCLIWLKFLVPILTLVSAVHRCQRQAVVLAGGELGGGLLHGSSGVRVGVPEPELAR